jgi:Domain of unknown function (DUF4340)
MQPRSLVLLILVTVVSVAAAAGALATGGEPSPAAGADQRALPALAARLDDVAAVEIRRAGLDFTFVRDGQNWLVKQKGDYPADAGKVRRIVLALADMTLVEPKTREPALYPRLQVEDPGKGQATLVTVSGKSGDPLGRLIVGKHSYDRLGEGNDGVYIRKPGDPQSWLARGALDFSDDGPSWLQRRIIDIPDNRVAKVVLTPADGAQVTLERTKPDAKFVLENPPKDAKVKGDSALAEPGMALETLDLEDVAPAAKLQVPAKGVASAAYTTFDGLTLEAKLFHIGDKNWVKLAATGSGKAAEEAKKLDTRFSRWIYAIPGYKAKMLETKFADLVEPAKSP